MTPPTKFYQLSVKGVIDPICIKPRNNSVISIANGKSVEVFCLYCNKVYKSEAGLKCHRNRCKETEKYFG